MLKIDLIVLGKIKEKYLNEAIDEYKNASRASPHLIL